MPGSELIIGPRAVAAAIEAGRPIDRITVANGARGANVRKIVEACREARIPLRFEPRARLDRLAEGLVHQGVVAVAAERATETLRDALARVGEEALFVALDGVEDPRNFGAVVRSAHAAGADAVLVPARRSAPLGGASAKAAAGALEHLAVVRVTNLNRALDKLKQEGFWIYGLDERGESIYDECDYGGRIVLVLGGEGKGLHRLTAEKCDFLVRIPMEGKIASLNVSVAAGIVLFEARRRRSLKR